MLKEFMENKPFFSTLSFQEFQKQFIPETLEYIQEKSGVNLSQSLANLESAEIEKIVEVAADIQAKIRINQHIEPNSRAVMVEIVMRILFDIWQKSESAELFFIKIRQKFEPAHIAAFITAYAQEFSNYEWITKFFAEHLQIFPRSNKKIRTIGIYYPRIFNGGVERFLSLIIPIYIQQSYRVVLFNDVARPEIEYPLPPPR